MDEENEGMTMLPSRNIIEHRLRDATNEQLIMIGMVYLMGVRRPGTLDYRDEDLYFAEMVRRASRSRCTQHDGCGDAA